MAARDTALRVLIACRKRAAWSNGVLKDMIAKDKLDKREAALATRLCYGTMQNKLLLDFYLGQLVTGSIKRVQPIVRDVLRLGLYQLYFTDKIPDSAAVSFSAVGFFCTHGLRRRWSRRKNTAVKKRRAW